MDADTKRYLFFGLIVVTLFFVLVTLNKIEQPLQELAKLPRCENNEVIVTNELRSNIIKFSNNYITTGTGESYFGNHYHFLNLEYSAVECVFVVKYDFTYDELHSPMSITIAVFSEDSMEVIETRAFLRPVSPLIDADEAVALANRNVIAYDYYNLEIDLPHQTFVYKFYKDSLTEGLVVVFEVDAQSKEIKTITRVPEINPIV